MFRKPVNQIPLVGADVLKEIITHFFSCQWHEVYDFLEFVLDYHKGKGIGEILKNVINDTLEKEMAGYRYVGGRITDITDDQEVEMLESALADDELPSVRVHLRQALNLLSDRQNPYYRNQIKESISAVESMANQITGKTKATLGEALKLLDQTKKTHPALMQGFLKLYGYTSDADGIRHAMEDDPNLSAADAKYFLLSCTSFINYLKSRM